MNIFLQNISQNILPYEEFNYGTKYLFIRVLLLFLFNGVALFFENFSWLRILRDEGRVLLAAKYIEASRGGSSKNRISFCDRH